MPTTTTGAPDPLMVATCWTSAGDVLPTAPDERSPHSAVDRVSAVAAAGWHGIGLAQDDLREVRDTLGFASLREQIADSGLVHTEVELLAGWWTSGAERERSDEVRSLLLDAAEQLGAAHIKVGTTVGPAASSIDVFVEPLRRLAEEAAERGTRIAIEAMPFSMIATVPMSADLARAVDHPACGVLVDAWHVFRAGTTLDELERSLSPDILFGVELDDADELVSGTLFEDTVRRRRLCGEGVFDLSGLVRVIDGLGWTGGWGVEILSDDFRALPLDVALASALATGRDTVLDSLRHLSGETRPPAREGSK